MLLVVNIFELRNWYEIIPVDLCMEMIIIFGHVADTQFPHATQRQRRKMFLQENFMLLAYRTIESV